MEQTGKPRSQDRGRTDLPLIEHTIGEELARVVAAHPGNEALVVPHQSVRLTYAQFWDEVDRVARGLLALGLAPGDRVGIWAPNVTEWVLVQFATARLGVILVNINPAYRTHEVQYALQQSGCRALVAAPSFKTSSYVDMVAEVRPQLPRLEHVVFLDGPDWDGLLERAVRCRPMRCAAVESGLRTPTPSTSSTPAAPPGSRRAQRSATATSSTTAGSWGRGAASPMRTASRCRCRSTTASAW
jgi:fatty-acyl-CoA synthase